MLARITDGIYRQPGSALAKLIEMLTMLMQKTCISRRTPLRSISTIRLRHDGRGLSIEALANLIYHMASSKRTQAGVGLGVAKSERPKPWKPGAADASLARSASGSSRFPSLLAISR